MSEAPAPSRSSFAARARQQVRDALALAAQRTPENATRISAELESLGAQAATLGLASIADLARRASEEARKLATESSAVTACARLLRELGRALEVVEREAPPAAPAKPSGGRRVLIVDDSSLNAAVVCDALERASFETRHSEDGDTAVAAITQFQPDVVLADVHIPGLTTAELCARLRAAAGDRRLQVLLFSGLSDAALAELAQEVRADGFVSKNRGLAAVVEEVTNATRCMAR